MKRNKVLVILVFLIVSLSTLLLCVVNLTPEKEITGNLFAIMLEEDDGTYYESDLEIFPIDYEYNSKKSYCVNGSQLIWNNDVKSVSIDTTGSEKCYLYFDKIYYEFAYTGTEQMFTVPSDGNYKIEVWGASGTSTFGEAKRISIGGKGAYTSGIIALNANDKLYIYVGENSEDITINSYDNPNMYLSTYNGGGAGGIDDLEGIGSENGYPGGGSTDIRIVSGVWNEITSLNSRIMVSAGGGGGGWTGNNNLLDFFEGGADAGGLIGYTISSGGALPANQTSGNAFGVGDSGNYISTVSTGDWHASGSGSGYYGGISVSIGQTQMGGSGGSSFISGHTGAVAITSASNQNPKSGCTTGTTNNACSIHYSGYTFSDTVMIDGAGYNWTNVKGELVAMPSPTGGTYPLGTGHTGHGFAKITYIN